MGELLTFYRKVFPARLAGLASFCVRVIRVNVG